MTDLRSATLWWAVGRRLKHDQPFVVAITGSIAKTSTKQAIGAVLEAAFPGQVRVGYGNLNTYLGVPLAVLGFEIDFYARSISWQWLPLLVGAIWRSLFKRLPRYLVLEFGADRPGDIVALTKKVKPNVAVVTLVGPAHLENYPSEAAIASEKAKLLTALGSGGVGFINVEDKHRQILEQAASTASLKTVQCPRAAIASAFARAVGEQLKVSDELIETVLRRLTPPKGRLSFKKAGSFFVLDDSYNANPLSMESALGVLRAQEPRRVAILGSMLELGPNAPHYHQQIGELARRCSDYLIGVGQLAKHYEPDLWFEHAQDAAKAILPYLKDGDRILVKGSHSIRMDKIVEAVVSHGSA